MNVLGAYGEDGQLLHFVRQRAEDLAARSVDEIVGVMHSIRQRRASEEESESLLAEALAATRELALRTIDVTIDEAQLLGAAAMCRGGFADVPVGEPGSAELPAIVWYTLAGANVHVAGIDARQAALHAQRVAPLLAAAGISMEAFDDGASLERRKTAYGADVLFGSWNRFMSDHLQDELRDDLRDVVQPPHQVAVLIDATAILVDRASVPVYLDAPMDVSDADRAVLIAAGRELRRDVDYVLGDGQVALTRRGIDRVVQLIGYAPWRETGSGVLLQRMETVLRDSTLRSNIPDSTPVHYGAVTVPAYYSLYQTVVGVGLAADHVSPASRRALEYEAVREVQRRLLVAMRRSLLTGRDPQSPARSGGRGLEMLLDLASVFRSYHDLPAYDDCVADFEALVTAASNRAPELDAESARSRVRGIALMVVDNYWTDHSNALDFMRKHGRAIYPGKLDVLREYKKDTHERFVLLLRRIRQRYWDAVLASF